MRRALLVTHEHVVHRVVEHRVVGGQDSTAGIAKDRGHAFADQTFPDDLCAAL